MRIKGNMLATTMPGTSKFNHTIDTSVNTPTHLRGRNDLRSPGAEKTPTNSQLNNSGVRRNSFGTSRDDKDDKDFGDSDGGDGTAPRTPAVSQPQAAQSDSSPTVIPNFMAQTDKYGNASTPRSQMGTMNSTPSTRAVSNTTSSMEVVSDNAPADTLLDSLRHMCCCLLLEDGTVGGESAGAAAQAAPGSSATERRRDRRSNGKSTPKTAHNTPIATSNGDPRKVGGMLLPTSRDDDGNPIKLLEPQLPEDIGKKCLVLDLDETLVHSSFRAVPGADFVIPVQIEDVVHFVYVAKRPGVDEFLIEMAKHYEIVIYTASLNKYADPLLDLLDPHKTIRYRLFRESCVYYEGNYVKDLSLINRDLSQSIIIDNSPSSYIFHPENAIDCSSFIEDPADRELDQIGSFLEGIKNVGDVRHLSNLWREWPNIDYQNVDV